MHKRIINKQIIIENYSLKNSTVYENYINKNFLYGEATKKFIKNIKINNKDNIIADIGCGTGFVFELISKKYKNQNINFYGIDPAKGMLEIANKKMQDLNASDVDAAMRMVAGTARSMGIVIEG